MKILIKRLYHEDACTVGCLQVVLSGKYESEFASASTLKPHSQGGLWMTLCDTLEPHAIAWEDIPLIGQRRGQRIPGRTAIPEGEYCVTLLDSRTYKRTMPLLVGVPEFKSVVLRTGKTAEQSRGDILVGRAEYDGSNYRLEDSRTAFNRLFALIDEAIDYGEEVKVEVRSPRRWRYPPQVE